MKHSPTYLLTVLAFASVMLLPASAHSGTLPVELEVSLEQSTLVVGQPLVIEMQVTNTGSDTLDRFSIGSSEFSLIWYFDSVVVGCELDLIAIDPPPPLPPKFGFHWNLSGLEPGETASCQVTYPQTLFPGLDTISLSGYTWLDDTFVVYDLAEFTYVLLPSSGAPFLIEVGLEHPIVFVGESLVIDLRLTNLGSESLEDLSILSSELSMAGNEGYGAEGCMVDTATPDPGLSEFHFDWSVPALEPGENASCRLMFPQTLNPGEEIIQLSGLLDGVLWESEAAFGYQLLPPTEPPIEVEVDLEQSTLRVGEPLIFDMHVTNVSPEPLTPFSIVGQPFFLTDFFPIYTEGCTLSAEWRLHGWPLWEPENLREGFVFYWDVPALQPGETVSCHVTLPNTWHTGQDTIGLSTWIDSPPWTPWRNLAQFNYTLLPADTIFHDRFE